jgi:hypothetical protein
MRDRIKDEAERGLLDEMVGEDGWLVFVEFVDGERKKGFLTTGEPHKEFDASLKAAGVKLPKPAKK